MAKRRDGQHARYGSPFASLIYAFRKDDERIVHVRDVDSGFDENLLCPAPDCRSPLIARKGPRGRVEHFAHHPGARVCGAWQETSAHYEAKAALAAAKTMTLPGVVAEYDGVQREVSREGHIDFDSVEVEFRMDGMTPDVVLRKTDRTGEIHELFVEIKVTHGCGPDKIAKIRKGRHAAIEIDLGKYKRASLEDIHRAVLSEAPRVWLYNGRRERAVAEIKAEVEARADALARTMLGGLDGPDQDRASQADGMAAVEALRTIDEARLCTIPVDDDAVFQVPTQEWQAALAHQFILIERGDHYLRPGFSLVTAATWIRGSGLVLPAFREPLGSEIQRALRRARRTFRSPQQLVKQYLQAVAELGPLQVVEPDCWARRQAFGEAVKAARDRERRRVQILEGARRRLSGMLSAATEEEQVGFDLEHWETQPVEGFGLTLDRLCGSERFAAFDEGLRAIETALGWSGRWTGGALFGLPLAGAVRRAVDARLAREAAAAAAKVEAERQRIARLVDRIEAEAVHLLGARAGAEWVEPKRPTLEGGDEARAEAWRDLAEIEQAQRAQAALDALAATVRDKLRKAAEARFGDLADWFLHTGNNHCQGQHPWDYTVDRHTLRDALRAVEMAPKTRRR